MKSYECALCGHLYSEADGDPMRGIAPGTLWADMPEEWVCPDCGAMQDNFEMSGG